MKQAQYQPMRVWEMALTLFAVNNDYMDGVDVSKAGAFERALRDFIRSKHAALVEAIESAKDLSKENETALRAAIEAFVKTGAY
jgi:F-type H+-transporting ATPase subunit alpha